ncbi:MAG: GDSL family lipase [Microbacteriaceae bacterium]|nr:GDSL family lipase [Burkholderiaceae bacterium]
MRVPRNTLWWLAVAAGATVLLTTGGCAVWRLGEARALARASEPFQQLPAAPAVRLLVVGDSTGVGTGATQASRSVAGLLGSTYPRLLVHNRARDGAKFNELPTQLEGSAAEPGYDIILISAGGNDVIRGTDADDLTKALDQTFAAARARLLPGGQIIVQPAGNVGNAPFFMRPLSSLMTRRAGVMHTAIRAAAARHGVTYINLYKQADQDPFAQQPGLHASDGLHPSDAGYQIWRDELLAQSDLGARLAPAR